MNILRKKGMTHNHQYEFWYYLRSIGPEEVRIIIPGDSEKEVLSNHRKFIRAIRRQPNVR